VNARALAAWSFAGLAITLLSAQPAYRALGLLAALLVVLHFAPGGPQRALLLKACGVACCTAIVLNVALSHVGAHAVVHVPDALPAVGGDLTLESLVFGISAALGIAASILFVSPLALLLETHQVLDALPRWLERTGITITVALSLVPGIARSITAVREAQQLRGWRARGLGSWREVLVPVVMTAVEDSIRLAEAMEARAFGSGRRSRYVRPSWTAQDALVLCGAAVAAAGFAGSRVLGLVPEWYPYPELTIPELSLPGVAACLLLLIPLVAWRSQP
jgi:energy-coupling factor transport system permease protein